MLLIARQRTCASELAHNSNRKCTSGKAPRFKSWPRKFASHRSSHGPRPQLLRRGPAPSALRVAGLHLRLKELGHHVEDIGNVSVRQAEEQPYGEKSAKYLNEIAETCRGLADATERSLAEGFVPLVLGGDHSLAVGSVSGVSHFFSQRSKKAGLLWLDAHGDMNTPDSSPSGNVHGMPLGIAARLWSARHLWNCSATNRRSNHATFVWSACVSSMRANGDS